MSNNNRNNFLHLRNEFNRDNEDREEEDREEDIDEIEEEEEEEDDYLDLLSKFKEDFYTACLSNNLYEASNTIEKVKELQILLWLISNHNESFILKNFITSGGSYHFIQPTILHILCENNQPDLLSILLLKFSTLFHKKISQVVKSEKKRWKKEDKKTLKEQGNVEKEQSRKEYLAQQISLYTRLIHLFLSHSSSSLPSPFLYCLKKGEKGRECFNILLYFSNYLPYSISVLSRTSSSLLSENLYLSPHCYHFYLNLLSKCEGSEKNSVGEIERRERNKLLLKNQYIYIGTFPANSQDFNSHFDSSLSQFRSNFSLKNRINYIFEIVLHYLSFAVFFIAFLLTLLFFFYFLFYYPHLNLLSQEKLDQVREQLKLFKDNQIAQIKHISSYSSITKKELLLFSIMDTLSNLYYFDIFFFLLFFFSLYFVYSSPLEVFSTIRDNNTLDNQTRGDREKTVEEEEDYSKDMKKNMSLMTKIRLFFFKLKNSFSYSPISSSSSLCALSSTSSSSSSPSLSLSSYKESLEELTLLSQEGAIRNDSASFLCHACMRAHPIRVMHSRISGACLKKFDHYCIFLLRDISEGNLKSFYLFLFSITFGLIPFLIVSSSLLIVLHDVLSNTYSEFVKISLSTIPLSQFLNNTGFDSNIESLSGDNPNWKFFSISSSFLPLFLKSYLLLLCVLEVFVLLLSFTYIYLLLFKKGWTLREYSRGAKSFPYLYSLEYLDPSTYYPRFYLRAYQ